MRRKNLFHHLNPQLKKTMKSDFTSIQSYLFGEDFGVKVKEKLDTAAVLQKVVYQQPAKGKFGFQTGYPCNFNQGQGGG